MRINVHLECLVLRVECPINLYVIDVSCSIIMVFVIIYEVCIYRLRVYINLLVPPN